MSINKPSSAEDEHFKKADLERLARLRSKLDQARDASRQEHQKQEHWMHCPKCGTVMQEVLLRQVMVDSCESCGYVGFDAGELELLLGQREPVLVQVARELRNAFTIGRAPKDPLLKEVTEDNG